MDTDTAVQTPPVASTPVHTNGLTTSNSTFPPAAPESRFSKEDIEKARQEEKDKVYSKVDDLTAKFQEAQKEITALREAREAEVKTLEEKQKAAEEAARKKAEDEMSAKELLAQKEKEWTERFSEFEQQRNQERLVFQKEQEFNQLRSYTQSLVQAALASDEIAPELADFVSGNTKEEIDASLDIVRAKSEAIVQSIAQAQVQTRAAMKGVSPTGYSATGPLDTNPGQQSYSVDDLKNMPMHEYAKIRDKLIPAASQGQNRGLYS